MTGQYYGWQVHTGEKTIDLIHEESGHSFAFDRKDEEPFIVEERFSGVEAEDTEIEYDNLVDRAFEIAYEVASKN